MLSEWITINPASLFDLLIFSISASLACAFYAAYWRLGRRRLDLIFSNLLLVTTVYAFAALMADNASSALPALRWIRVIYTCALLVLVLIVHFAFELAGKRSRRVRLLVAALYGAVPLWTFISYHPQFLRARGQPTGLQSWMNAAPWLPETGPLLDLYLGYCLVLWLLVFLICGRLFWSAQNVDGTLHHIGMLLRGLVILMITAFLSAFMLTKSICSIDFTLIGFMAICLPAARGLARQMLQKARLKEALSRYVSPQVTSEIIENGLYSEGELRDVTILFTDIRGFTVLSEQMSPENVVRMLNRYFDVMARTVIEHGGMFNKTIGDGILAIFGAPQMLDNNALSAVQAAQHMQTAIGELNLEFERDGLAPLRVGMGLHSGPVVVGNVGGETRVEYTAIGDVVNVACRVEQHTKVVHCPILVTDATFQRIRMFVAAHPVGEAPIRLGGRSVAVLEVAIVASARSSLRTLGAVTDGGLGACGHISSVPQREVG